MRTTENPTPTTETSPPTPGAGGRGAWTPYWAWLTAAALLWAGALGLGIVLKRLHVVFERAAAPLRRPLRSIPARLGPFVLVREFPPLTQEAAGALRARNYITRMYRCVAGDAAGVDVRVHIAYFSGTPDTVIHVPEICYVAAGVRNARYEQGVLAVPQLHSSGGREVRQGARPVPREIPVRMLHFIPPGGDREETVLYFFVANGRFLGMPEEVRALIFDLRRRAVYWCKVELWAPGLEPRAARRVCGRFLAYLLPELFACLPQESGLRRRSGLAANVLRAPLCGGAQGASMPVSRCDAAGRMAPASAPVRAGDAGKRARSGQCSDNQGRRRR